MKNHLSEQPHDVSRKLRMCHRLHMSRISREDHLSEQPHDVSRELRMCHELHMSQLSREFLEEASE